ncbi:hypothetical protein Rsub_01399 [Raphidocelis subcapitata]|uniref:EF-hand domain-containing protein n=1 Tax=Raphidocelis subcapitata TaxID=307507 RepID=A0A2V0NTL1_9CHLO|nr:hypothetical protein Rsub_01399 [Raphidocelis subcapitata]|eukprot:GBF88900.1 hypothetical protein Rsub_01399 [Raphidocelis subcapitata]
MMGALRSQAPGRPALGVSGRGGSGVGGAARRPPRPSTRVGGTGAGGGSGGAGAGGPPRRGTCSGGDDGGDDGSGGPPPPRRRPGLLLASLALSLLPAAPALARQKEGHGGGDDPGGGLWGLLGMGGLVTQRNARAGRGIDSAELDAFANSMVELWRPILANMGLSGAMGVVAGAAFKTVGRTLAAFLGLGFVSLQVLTYSGIVTVNWTKVHEVAGRVLDATGDGKLDADDYRRVLKQGLVVLSQGLPSTSGFLAGFLLGLRMF